MRKWRVLLIGSCALLVVMVAMRWPRLDPEMVSVSRCAVSGDRMEVEYRMSRQFAVALHHGIRKARQQPDSPGVSVAGWTPVRAEKAAVIASSYDWLRGEHSVRLRFLRGHPLAVDANGRHLEIAAWSTPDAGGVRWLPPGERASFGAGVGHDILHFGASAEQEEYLMLYAGSDLQRVTAE